MAYRPLLLILVTFLYLRHCQLALIYSPQQPPIYYRNKNDIPHSSIRNWYSSLNSKPHLFRIIILHSLKRPVLRQRFYKNTWYSQSIIPLHVVQMWWSQTILCIFLYWTRPTNTNARSHSFFPDFLSSSSYSSSLDRTVTSFENYFQLVHIFFRTIIFEQIGTQFCFNCQNLKLYSCIFVLLYPSKASFTSTNRIYLYLYIFSNLYSSTQLNCVWKLPLFVHTIILCWRIKVVGYRTNDTSYVDVINYVNIWCVNYPLLIQKWSYFLQNRRRVGQSFLRENDICLPDFLLSMQGPTCSFWKAQILTFLPIFFLDCRNNQWKKHVVKMHMHFLKGIIHKQRASFITFPLSNSSHDCWSVSTVSRNENHDIAFTSQVYSMPLSPFTFPRSHQPLPLWTLISSLRD